MKYFTPEFFDSVAWSPGRTEKQNREGQKLFHCTADAYHRELEDLKSKVSRSAWNFFRHGFAEKGLHDARLLSIAFGDGLNYVADGKSPFRLNYQRTSVRVEFLGQDQSYRHSFDLRGVHRVDVHLSTEELVRGRCLGDLNTYELTLRK